MSTLQPGQMLGPYKIISQIGQGGMATVYKAYQGAMDRYVALKVLSFAFVQRQEFIDRFRNEARLIARLEHPNILPVYDFGDADGIPYLVMRFLESGTLKERLEAGTLPLAEVDRIFTQLAEALAYAHENGIIHRDIKPSNAMLDRRGQLFLTDFGIAKLLENSPEFTATGAITGTPAYMSPEQAQGSKLDHRSDIYSLAIVLYEMLAGRVPFEAETPLAVIIKHIQEPLVPITTLNPTIHPAIELVLLKALDKNPQDRFQSVSAFLSAWQEAMLVVRQGGTASGSFVPASVSAAERATERLSSPGLPDPVVAHAAPTLRDAAQPPAPKPAALSARRALPRWAVIALVAVGAVVVVGLAAFAFNQFNKPEEEPAITLPVTLPDGAAEPTEPPAFNYAWTSWTPANSATVLRFTGSSLLAGGPGGVTVWEPDGSSYQHIALQNGIPGAGVNDILLDGTDLWVATEEGLGRWNEQDGWTYFGSDNGLDSDFVTRVIAVGDEIWVGTLYAGRATSGLQKYDYTRFSPVNFPSADSDDPVMADIQTVSYNVTGIALDNSDNVWISTERGIAYWNAELEAWRLYTAGEGLPDEALEDQNFTAILFDESEDVLWAGTSNGTLYRFVEGEAEIAAQLYEGDLYTVTGLAIGSDDALWVSAAGGAAQVNRETLQVSYLAFSENRFPAYRALSVASAPDGRLVFGTQGSGLQLFDGSKFDTWYIPGLPTYEHFHRIIPAADGKVWFGEMYEDHYDIFDPASGTWETPPEPDACCLMAWDGEDAVYGSWDGLTIVKADGRTVQFNAENGFPDQQVNDAAVQSPGVLWVATETGLVQIENEQVTAFYTADDGLPSPILRTVRITADGSVWAGSPAGVSRRTLDGRWEHYYAGADFNEYIEGVTDVIDDGEGGFWIAVDGDGLYHAAGGKLTAFRYGAPGVLLPSSRLTSLALAPDGSLLIGTIQAGLVRMEGAAWNVASPRSGLSHPTVNDIYVSPEGVIWLATGSGISRISP